MLAGIVDVPPGPVRGWGVFAHGFTLGKDCPAASRICKQLASEGIGMLRFDNLGLGDSEGDWSDGSFSHKVDDTVRAVEFMSASGREARLLVGHSFGGAAVIAAAHDCPGVEAVASVGAPFEPAHVEHNYDALVQRIEAEGEAPFLAGGKALPSSGTFSRTSGPPICVSGSELCIGPCLSCIHRLTTRSASPMRATSSVPPGILGALSPWKGLTTFSPGRIRPPGPPESSAPGRIPICERKVTGLAGAAVRVHRHWRHSPAGSD